MSDSSVQILSLFLGMFTVFFGNIGVIWWFRKESREDWKMMHKENTEFKEAIRMDMKDFHERLLKIEMERK